MINHSQQHMRFKPDPLDIAMVDLKASTPQFNPTASAMIINESFSGTAIVMTLQEDIEPGGYIRVKVGRMDALRAEVVWFKRLDTDVVKIGINFLE